MITKTRIGWMILTLALLIGLAGGEAGAASEFNKTSGEWTNAVNWTPNGTPTAATTCYIGSSSAGDATVTIASGQDCLSGPLYHGQAASKRGTLDMSGGTLTISGLFNLGQNGSSTGIINQTGGTIANFNNVNVGNGSSSYGSWTLSGSSMATGMTSGSIYVPAGVGATGKLVVAGAAMWSNAPSGYVRIGYGGAGSDGTVEVQGGTFWANQGNSAWYVGASAGAVGRLVVSGGTLNIASGQGALLGQVASGTGIVSVSGGTLVGSGASAELRIGSAGAGFVYVTNTGYLNMKNLRFGYAAGSNAAMVVDNSAIVSNVLNGVMTMGNAAGNLSTLDIKGGQWVSSTDGTGENNLSIGFSANSTGIVTITGGTTVWTNSRALGQGLGTSAGSLGRVTISGGSLRTTGGSFYVGRSGRGEFRIQGGACTNELIFQLGYAAGGYGEIQVTNGSWVQSGALNVAAGSGGTGVVTVVNCVQTNITGAVTVGGGATVGDRYGSVTISNATFGGGTAVNVWTNGFVELTGTGSVFLCNTFTATGGSVTNHVRQFAGGVDVTNSASTALVITNGGKMFLSFDEIPSSSMVVWGLRWAGNNHSNDIQRLLDRGVLTWSQSAGPTAGIQTNATHSWFGYTYVLAASPVIDQGDNVTTNVNEGAGTLVLTNLVSATDPDSTPANLTWTNTTTPLNGTVVCTGTGTNPATFTYTATNADFNGTNSFLVRVMDEGGRSDSITVTVVVAAINDPPVCTVRPAVSGVLTPGGLLTGTSGTWNDTADTNFGGSSTLTYAYEWQYSTTNDGTGVNSLLDYDNQYMVQPGDVGKYVRLQVTCTNDGVGTPQVQVVTTNSDWALVISANAAPVINQAPGPLTTNMTEDGGTFHLANLVITASDADGDNLTWTSITTPSNGTVSVSGTGTNQVTWTAFTYTPNTNFYGTNSFVVQAADGKGGLASITVEVAVAAVNDPPVNTALPGFAPQQYPASLAATNGMWNDNADTNATYTDATFTNGATFGYQWWRADNGSGLNSNSIANATNQTYALTKDDRYKWTRVAVTCTDAGVPGNASTTAWSSWVQETSVAPATVTFTNALGNGAWGSYSNWSPDTVPQAGITTVIGDVNVRSPVTAIIGASDAAATKDLTLGNNAGASGSLEMSGGTLTGNGNVTVGSAAGSTGIVQMTGGTITNVSTLTIGNNLGYGDMTVSGSGAVYASYINLSPTGGVSSSLTVTNAGSVSGLYQIGGGADGIATVTLAGNSTNVAETGANVLVGVGARSTGYLYVRNNAMLTWSSTRPFGAGYGVGSTGIVEVSDNGVITNFNGMTIGYAGGGYGNMTVRNSGKVFVGGSSGVSIGGTNNNSILTVADDGEVRAGAGTTYVGNSAGSSGTLTVTNNGLFVCGSGGNWLQVGQGNNSIGWVNVNGGMISLPTPSARLSALGVGTGATGVLTITSGVYSNADSGANTFSIGYGANSAGRVQLQGGTLYMAQATTLGAAAGAVGSITNTGGTWVQIGTLGVGVTASGTGLVSVANTVQTNISGAVTVGGGATGDRYGSVTLTNATFGGTAAMTVWTNGFVELTGTGSTFRCSTFTCRGGALTNHVRQLAGGLDVTSSANTALVITNGGSVYLSFDEGPAGGVSGNFWGLRWAGNRTAEVAAMTNANALAWGGAAVAGVGIYTNATHTFVGYFINTPPVVTNAGKTVTINMSEDGSFTPATLYATDAEGDTLTWTNGTVTPANGTVGVINVASSNLTSYTYAPATNWNGTDSFKVEVRDGRGGVDTGTVTVVVAAVNDPPVCSAGPTVSGLYQIGVTLSNDYTGAWSDATDTNVSGSSSFTFTWQWQRADSEGGAGAGNIADATNVTYLLGTSDTGKYVRVEVTCTDNGVGSGGNQSVTTNTVWTLVTAVNNLPVITNGNGTVVANLTEDGGPTDLQVLLNLGATDDDPGQTATLVWTNSTSPNNGSVSVSGTGASPAMSFTPNPNWNGTNTFVVRVTDTVGGSDEITVEVRVAPVNDAPTNTVAPGYTGTRLVGNVLTVTNGVWNDNVDTNASYSGSALAFAYQWQRATNGSGDGLTTIVNATNAAYTLTWEDKYKWVRAAVTCTDGGFPLPGSNATANTSWLQETSTVPTLVTFTNLVGNRLWNVAGNWAPADVPTPTMTTVIGDTNVLSPATALIGASDTALTKELTLGNNAGASGSLEMSGGTLTGNGTLVLGNGNYSTGTITQTGGTLDSYNNVYVGRGNTSDVTWAVSGSSVVTGLMGNFYMGGDNGTVGAGSKARLTVSGSAVWSNTFNGVVAYVAAGQNSDSTLEANGGTLYLALGNNTTIPVGSQPGSIGRLNVTSGRMDIVVPQGVVLGANATSTGIVTVAGGSFTAGRMAIGGPGMGSVYVTNTGAFTLTDSIGIGLTMGYAAGSNAYFLVDGSGSYTGKQFSLGKAAGNVSVADLRGGSTYVGSGNAGDGIVLGSVAGSTGIVNVAGGRHVWEHGASGGYGIGQASNSLGRVTITGGSLTTIGEFSYGYYGVGELNIAGGAFTNNSTLNLGRSAGGVGRVTVTGGTWVQGGALNVGSAAAGVTGVVSVVNCVSTNISGAVTVGGGATGDRYGSVTLTNATFGGTAAVTVWTNGFVELTGTGSVLRCSTFTCRGGTVTNRVRQLAGGVDVTSSANTALVITNGGKMHLVFEVSPGRAGDFWGLRWAGNRTAELAAMTNANALTWGGAAATGVGIYTNATHTMVGYYAQDSGTTFRFR